VCESRSPRSSPVKRRNRAVAAAVEALETRLLFHLVVTSPLADVATSPGSSATNVDLNAHFDNNDFSGTIAKFDTIEGSFFIELSDAATPITVQNILHYLNTGLYANTFIHRTQQIATQ